MTRLQAFLLVSVTHLVATVGLTLAVFGQTLDRFDTGLPATAAERAIDGFGAILRFPLVTAALASGLRFPGLIGWAPFVLNSLLWAAVVGLWPGRRGGPPRTPPGRDA